MDRLEISGHKNNWIAVMDSGMNVLEFWGKKSAGFTTPSSMAIVRQLQTYGDIMMMYHFSLMYNELEL